MFEKGDLGLVSYRGAFRGTKPVTVCEASWSKPPSVAVRVVTAPVKGQSNRAASWNSSEAHAQEVFMRGGEMVMFRMATMMY